MKFRPYSQADRDACRDIFRSNTPLFFKEHEESDFLDFVDKGDCPYFVIEGAQGAIACGGVGYRGQEADLCWGMVHADAHGKRLGAAMLFGRLAQIAESDATSMRLETSQHTSGFFRRFGFEVQEITPDGLAQGLDKVEMRAELSDTLRREILEEWRVRQSGLERGESKP